MIDSFAQAMHDWQTFYFMIGTASATLIGLMFIAVSLGADLPAATDSNGISTFVTPMLIHFGSVLAISATYAGTHFSHHIVGHNLIGDWPDFYCLCLLGGFAIHPPSGQQQLHPQ